MSDILGYKGYKTRVEFDAEDRIFFRHVAGIEDGVGFHANTVDDLIAAFMRRSTIIWKPAQIQASNRTNPMQTNVSSLA